MKGGIGNLMKQAQLVQENMKKLQEQLGTMEVEGQAGSGMVKVVMSGRHEVKRVTLDPRVLADDREMLEDLIAAAVNDAVRKIETVTQEKMAAATAGLPLPPGLKLPF
jgi:DNA-binding YbaB/EbfC family protein